MKAVFLSASVPRREPWLADSRLKDIQEAVAALVAVIPPQYELVFGGHPDISPFVEQAATSIGARKSVHIFQSREFEGKVPEVAKKFENLHWTDRKHDQASSLLEMRWDMLQFREYLMAVFIGGMEGIFDEYSLFRKICPNKPAYAIGSTGSASAKLLEEHREEYSELGLYHELATTKLYRSLFARLRDQATMQESTASLLPKILDSDNRELLALVWPVFKPQFTGSGAFAGGSPKDVLEEWLTQVLPRISEAKGNRGDAVTKILSNPKNASDPQKVSIVAAFLQEVFRSREFSTEALTGLVVSLFRNIPQGFRTN